MTISVNITKQMKDGFKLAVAFAASNETLGFLGASGSGKSLTLRAIAGLEKPDSGKIVVNDVVFYDSDQRINLSPQQRQTALLFQNYSLFPNLTVAQNIAAGFTSVGSTKLSKLEIKDKVDEQLSRFGIKGYGKRYPASLSGGQQQRVALARMLAADPPILMLDEPFSALDEFLKSNLEAELIQLFAEFKGTVLYVSHDIDEAFRFCDRIAVYEDGQILQLEAPDTLITKPNSLATLKVTGVKNVVEIADIITQKSTVSAKSNKQATFRRSKVIKEANVPLWGCQLKSVNYDVDLGHNFTHLGIRCENIKLLGKTKPTKVVAHTNYLQGVITLFIDSRFTRTVYIKLGSDPNTANTSHNIIQCKYNLDSVKLSKLAVGDKIWLAVDYANVMLV